MAIERVIVRIYVQFGRAHRGALRKEWDVNYHLGIKVDGGHNGELPQGFPNSGMEYLPNNPFVLKLNFRFSWVYVTIDGAGINIKKEEVWGEGIRREYALLPLNYCLMQVGALHVALVYKKKLLPWAFLGPLWAPNKTCDANYRRSG